MESSFAFPALCPAGEDDADEDGQCSPCAKGFYKEGRNENQCQECPGQQTTVDLGSTNATDCYSELTAWAYSMGESCVNSPQLGALCWCFVSIFKANFLSPAACNPGSYVVGLACESCPRNKYQNEHDQNSCKDCPDDLRTEGKGSTSVDFCLSKCRNTHTNTTHTQSIPRMLQKPNCHHECFLGGCRSSQLPPCLFHSGPERALPRCLQGSDKWSKH